MYICVCVYIYIYVYVCMCLCVCLCVCVCVCACVCVCIYIYICTTIFTATCLGVCDEDAILSAYSRKCNTYFYGYIYYYRS